MSSTTWALLIATALVAASAFFVAVEFAAVAARPHRLEEAARTRSAARAALRGVQDLSMTLAGCQLGITLCTLGLGATAKPAVHDVLEPVLHEIGLPGTTADVAAFVIALAVVTFVHLVVGEMTPKSWAIAHPERSAIMLSLPMQAFMRLTRPMLLALNGLANVCLRAVGVDSVDVLDQARDPRTLRELVDHSAKVGTLDEQHRHQLLTALDLDQATVGSVLADENEDGTPDEVSGVQAADDVARILDVARSSRHLRLVVHRGHEPVGMVHVRDVLTADPRTTAEQAMRPVISVAADEPVYAALATLRDQGRQLALVREGPRLLGVITMQDLVNRLLPR